MLAEPMIDIEGPVQKGAQKNGQAVFRTPCQPGRNSGQPKESKGLERLRQDGWGHRRFGQRLNSSTQSDLRFNNAPAAFSKKRLASSI